ncbi:hypothetical protein [Paenibacillus sp. DYY-L-2]|uniref:hypothetical protein n=1 Tax=Paenibacillus sp. DYY-L-2 TaxID=3447013 RepID=UPI003F50C6E5
MVELKRKELVQWLGISDRTLNRWIKRNLPYTVVRESYQKYQVFDTEQVIQWMNQQSKEVKSK